MAEFKPIYDKYISPNEGGYAFVKHDPGGETAYGISRKYNPRWEGWEEIDRLKKYTELHNGQFIKSIEAMAEKFYRESWDKYKFGAINSENVAAIFFDFFVNSGYTAIRALQHLTNVPEDGVMGPRTIEAINKRDPEILFKDILEHRYQLYLGLVDRNPLQQKFFGGWMNRLKKFEHESI